MDQHNPSVNVPPAECPLCKRFATVISSLLSRQPEKFDLDPLELLSGQILYERADEIDGYDLFSGLHLEENAQCSTCATLAESIIRRALRKVPEPISTLKASKLSLSGPMCPTGCFILDIETTNESYDIRIVPSYFANSLKPDPSLIDLGMIRNWVQICDSRHAGQCHTFSNDRKRCHVDMRMVDVLESCIVAIGEGQYMPEYTALSYVWGKVQTLLCTKAIRQDLEVPGSLDTAPFSLTLARTIRDAMTLTKSLGLRYLWADMLCIVQDDPSDKVVQLPNMANIYGDAYFTIVAADGTHAQGGIPGVSRQFPRTSLPPLLRFDTLSLTANFALKPDTEEGREKLWHTRAWTMQERALSRRTLMFLDQTVSWTCMQASFDEETFSPASSDSAKACYYCQASSVSDTCFVKRVKWPHLDNYSEMVSIFTERSMTCPDDMLNAFAGILVALQPSFPHGFLQGLPEFFFDVALLWRRIESVHSRRASRPFRRCVKGGKQWASTHFASWSWAGWEDCRVQWPLLYNDAVDWEMEVIPISPITSWKIMNEHGGLSAVRNGFYQRRICAQDSTQLDLNEGWERMDQGTSLSSSPDASSRFKHPHAPGMKFRYPLPIADLRSERPTLDLHSMYLKFNSAVCSFTFREEVLGFPFPQGSLYTAKEVWAGFIHDIQTSVLAEDLDSLACEVVAISTGFVNINRERLLDKRELDRIEDVVPEVAHFPQIRESGDVYHFYNVMWLAWEEGIGYRRGIGRVWKPVWEQQKVKQMEITLG